MTIVFRGETKRFKATFTDTVTGNFDPSASTLKIYDPDGNLAETYDLADLSRVSEGVYYVDYTFPSDGEFGRWFASWTGTNGTFVAEGTDYVQLMPTYAPTIDEVRNSLGGMEDDRVIPDAIIIAIADGMLMVDKEKSATAPTDDISRAYLACSSYQAYLTYASEFERTAGIVPGPILNHLRELKEKCAEFVAFTKRGGGQTAIGPIKSYTPTVVPETYEPDAEGEPV